MSSCDCSEAWSDDSMVYTSLILTGLCKDPSAPIIGLLPSATNGCVDHRSKISIIK